MCVCVFCVLFGRLPLRRGRGVAIASRGGALCVCVCPLRVLVLVWLCVVALCCQCEGVCGVVCVDFFEATECISFCVFRVAVPSLKSVHFFSRGVSSPRGCGCMVCWSCDGLSLLWQIVLGRSSLSLVVGCGSVRWAVVSPRARKKRKDRWSGTPFAHQGLLHRILALCSSTVRSVQFCLLCDQPEPIPGRLTARVTWLTPCRPCRLPTCLGSAIDMLNRM